MKKSSILLSAAMAVFALGSCQDNLGTIELNNGYTVAFSASVDQATKTTLDGYTVNWAEGDVIWAVTTDEAWGKPYADDNDGATIANFTCSGGVFSSELTIAAGRHTFNLLYGGQRSYHRGAGTTVQISNQDEDVAHPTASVAKYDALAGSFTATMPQTAPATVNMNHLFTLMKVNVKNESGAAVAADKFTFTAPSGINVRGVYDIDFSATPVTASYSKNGSNEIIVALSNGTIAAGATVPVYFVMAPCTLSGDVTMKVSAGEDTYTVKKSVSNKTFEAGKLNTASLTISSKDVTDSKSLPYEESFKSAASPDFTTTGGSIWSWKTYSGVGYMYATSGSKIESEAWLISPWINLGSATNPVVSFEHTHKFAGTPSNELTLWVKQQGSDTWNPLTINTYGSNTDWTFVTNESALTSYVGKTVKIGFKYVSTTSAYGTWEVRNFKVDQGEAPTPETKTFSLKAESVEVGSDATSATMTVYGNASFTVNCPSGVTADPSSFAGSESNVYTAVTLSFASNPTTSPKTYTITATTTDIVEGAQTLTFTVNHKAAVNIGGDSNKDIINHDAAGVWGTTYAFWGPKGGPSGAQYAGKTSGGNNDDVIQMRSSDSESGIVVTSATKYVKSVTITWKKSDSTYDNANKKVDIYGNINAFTSPQNLYNAANTVANVASSTYDDTELNYTYTFDKNYHYVGFRSNKGALYLSEIQVEWSATPVGEDPTPRLEKLATPQVTCTAKSETSLTFSWGAVENAVEYSVKFDGGEEVKTTDLTYTVNDLEAGSSHTLTVKAIADGVNYNDSSVGSCNAMTDSPAGVVTATFDFTSTTFLTGQGIVLPGSGAGTGIAGKTITVDSISLSSTDGGTATRIWNSSGSYDLRVYKNGGSLTLSAAGKTITKIVFTGSATSPFSVSGGTFERDTWTGSASSVTFTATDTGKIKTIVVTYE